LQRYLHEFDFRYNYRVGLGYSDSQHTEIAIRGAEGKRLTYSADWSKVRRLSTRYRAIRSRFRRRAQSTASRCD
jgi:hypothetical protein